MAKKASTKHQNRILASLSILLILGSSVPVGAVGAWIMRTLGVIAALVMLYGFKNLFDERSKTQ
jgi:hypothetical protein